MFQLYMLITCTTVVVADNNSAMLTDIFNINSSSQHQEYSKFHADHVTTVPVYNQLQ